MNSAKLRGRMTEKGYTQRTLAEKVGMSTNSLNRKLSGKRQFLLKEVIAICEVLEIDNPAPFFFD